VVATDTPDGRSGRGARPHNALLVVAFGLLAYAGVTALDGPSPGFGLSWSIVGGAGALGASAIMLAARRRSRRLEDAARLSMALAALAALAVGVGSAPSGVDRGFVIAVTGVLAAALALYALLAGDQRRAGRGAA
jgi:peptidoglycan/LPS O-acetylase OafA/YrhL